MKITDISIQHRNPDRVNISIDGKYRFSLDVLQVIDLGIKTGQEIDADRLAELEQESTFGKLYIRAFEYAMIRPRSAKEMREYLWRKTRAGKYKTRSGEIRDREGISKDVANRVYDRLVKKGYVSDTKFAKHWAQNRNLSKGISRRKLIGELRSKGVEQEIIDDILPSSARHDDSEIDKIIAKKRARYDDEKLMQYLLRQGFPYDLVKTKVFVTTEFPSPE